MLLIGLDELDGDADLEEDDPGEDGADHEPDESGIADQDALALDQRDEPSLGWTTSMNQTTRMPPLTGRYASAVEDGEAGDDNGIGDAGGLNFDAEENGDAEMDWEGEPNADLEYDYRDAPMTREQVVYGGAMTPAGFKPFGV
jgi:hypothetical protein